MEHSLLINCPPCHSQKRCVKLEKPTSMKAWSNIQISPQDSEITKINNLEKRLGILPEDVIKIRELITKFEVCHFKYQIHLKNIKDSITELKPNVNTTKIGTNHIQHGENVLNTDTSGKSLIGQQYVWALREWLNDNTKNEIPENYNKKFGQEIQKYLGDKNPEKLQLIGLLIARLTWDWKSYEKLQCSDKYKDIEYQLSRMDICHYAFPKNLDLLLKGIGQMKAVKGKQFEGCGSYNSRIRINLEKEFLDLNDTLSSLQQNNRLKKNDAIKIWLVACLAKTIKENLDLSIPITELDNRRY